MWMIVFFLCNNALPFSTRVVEMSARFVMINIWFAVTLLWMFVRRFSGAECISTCVLPFTPAVGYFNSTFLVYGQRVSSGWGFTYVPQYLSEPANFLGRWVYCTSLLSASTESYEGPFRKDNCSGIPWEILISTDLEHQPQDFAKVWR